MSERRSGEAKQISMAVCPGRSETHDWSDVDSNDGPEFFRAGDAVRVLLGQDERLGSEGEERVITSA